MHHGGLSLPFLILKASAAQDSQRPFAQGRYQSPQTHPADRAPRLKVPGSGTKKGKMLNLTTRETEGIKLDCRKFGNHGFVFTFVPIVYGCIFVMGIVGNSMVVAVIHCYMKLKTVANILVLNLAISDLTFLLTLPLWATFTATGYYWPFGTFLCKASAGLVILNLYTSIFFLTALSIDRYLAIVHPVQSRRFRSIAYARITCVLVWVFAFVLSMPTALTRDVHLLSGHNKTVCGLLQEKVEKVKKLNDLVLAIKLMKSLLGFLIPFIIIITCYCLIGRALLGAKRIQKSSRSRDDEVLRMLAATVLAFFLCWTPHQVFHFMDVLHQMKLLKRCEILDMVDTAMPFTICIAYFNSCINPIVYGFVGRQFRKNLLRLLRSSPRGATGPHPSISSKMSALSFRASEALSLTAKTNASADVK